LLLAALGLVNLIFTWRLLPETGHPTGRFNITSLKRDYRMLLSSSSFMGFVIGGGCATMASYAIIVSAPFILLQELHRPAHEVGFFLVLLMMGISSGNAITGRLVGKMAIETVLVRGNALCLASAALFLLATLTGALNLMVTG